MRSDDDARRMVRELWLRNRPLTLERLATVKAAVDQLAAGTLDPSAREEARAEAHKLRGILGTYGFADGSLVTGDAEDLLEEAADPTGAAELSARLAGCARLLAEES